MGPRQLNPPPGMKILLVNKFHYLRGGSETYYFGLADLLRQAGHEVACFAMQDARNLPCPQSSYFVSNIDYRTPARSGLRQLKAGAALFYSWEARRQFEKLLLHFRPDVIHLGLVHRQITFSILDAARPFNIPVVFSLHDLAWLCPCYTMLSNGVPCQRCLHGSLWNCVRGRCVQGSFAKSALGAMEGAFNRMRRYANRIDLFIAQCQRYKQLHLEGGFPEESIAVIPNFLPFDVLPTPHAPVAPSSPYLLYFGRLSPEKGLLRLLQAYASLGPAAMPLHLDGQGPMHSALVQHIQDLHLQDRVHLRWSANRDELQTELRQCHAVVLPSEWEENAPYSLIEAMTLGIPTLATRTGGFPEFIRDNQTGFLCDVGSTPALALALQRLCALSPEEYARISIAARTSALRQFSRETFIRTLTQQYERLRQRKGPTSFPAPTSARIC